MAHLKAPAMLFRRLGSLSDTVPLDELVASAPLMLIASTVMALNPAERRRHWVSCSIGKLSSAEVVAIAGRWWGSARESRFDGGGITDSTTMSAAPDLDQI